MKGTPLFYILDYGDWMQDGWEIADAKTGAGVTTTCGYDGWEHIHFDEFRIVGLYRSNTRNKRLNNR